MMRPRTIRDPVWGNIRLGAEAAKIVDTPEFQRLRRVKQLGVTHLVYPGGVHSRFLHAVGVYHLVSTAIAHLEREGHLDALSDEDRADIPVVHLAALLHDVGHYAFSHAMEELRPESMLGHHEEIATQFLEAGPIKGVLANHGPDVVQRIGKLICGESTHPLQGLIAGSFDLDKIDYLRRDALFCGVPYGAIDVDRLLQALTLAREEDDGPLELAVTEKGISALETLLFSKYQMFRNVYWHHAVRAATVVFVRLIETSLANGLLRREELAGPTDEELLGLIANKIDRMSDDRSSDRDSSFTHTMRLLNALNHRQLPKRVLELTGDQLPDRVSSWPSTRADLMVMLEKRMAEEWGVPSESLMLDYPSDPDMLDLNLLLVRKGAVVRRLTTLGERGLIDIPRLGRSLYHSARVLRVFSFDPIPHPDPRPLLELIEASEHDVESRLATGETLFG